MKNNSKPKILFVITGLKTGGAEIMLLKVLSKMDQECFSPEVVSLTDIGTVGPKIQALGIPVHSIGMRSGRPYPLSIWRFIRLVRRLQPDLLQGWMYHGNLAAQFVKPILSKRAHIIWSIHHSVYSLANEKWATAWVIRLCARMSIFPSRILYVAQSSATQHEHLGFSSKKCSVIPNGFNVDLFIPSEEARNQIRKELGLAPSVKTIGLIARYHSMKDHKNFLEAAAILLKSNPDAHFILAGKNIDRNNKSLMSSVQSLGLEGKIHFLGFRQDSHTLNAAFDIAANSSFSESFSSAIGEAMSCAVPCVVTDVGDSSLLVGETGIVVPPRSPEALARGWEKLLNIGNEGRKDLGRQARERIISNFSLDRIVSQYESLYENFWKSLDFKKSQN